MTAGVFRYGIDHIITRILPGAKHYVGQVRWTDLNFGGLLNGIKSCQTFFLIHK